MTEQIDTTAKVRHVRAANFDAKFPAAFGVLELQGEHEAGKSSTLTAFQKIVGQVPDGELEAAWDSLGGSLEWMGARLSLSTNRITGQIGVAGLSGIDPSLLADPGIDNEVSADGARIGYLCKLARVPADLSLFEGVAPRAELERLATPKTLAAKDLLALAGGLRRDLQTAARDAEAERDQQKGAADALLLSCGRAGLDESTDVTDFDAQLRAAQRRHEALQAQAEQAAKAEAAASKAREMLDFSAKGYDGPTVEQADSAVGETTARIAQLESDLATERAKLAQLKVQQLRAGEHESKLAAWRKSIDEAAAAVAVDPAELEQAAQDAQRADAAQKQATLDRKARADRAKAATHLKASDAAGKDAERLRAAADACDGAVTAAIAKIAPRGIKVASDEKGNPRLVVESKGHTIPFAKLSDGRRIIYAIDIALDALPKDDERPKLVVIRQSMWEQLLPAVRAEIHEHAKAVGAWVLTARVAPGPLRAVPFDEAA